MAQAGAGGDWERSAAAFEREWLAAASALDRLLLDLCARFHLQLPLAFAAAHLPAHPLLQHTQQPGNPLAFSPPAPDPAAAAHSLHHVLSALAALPLPPSQQPQPAASASGARSTGLAGSGECDALGAQRQSPQLQPLASLCFSALQAPPSSTSTPPPTPTHVPHRHSPAGTGLKRAARSHQVCVLYSVYSYVCARVCCNY